MSRALSLVLVACGATLCWGQPEAERALDTRVRDTVSLARSRGLTPAELAELSRVIEFGRKAHQGQTRDGGRPFFEHPLRIAEAVLRGTPSGERVNVTAVKAAILHDVLEDTRTTVEQMRKAVGTKTTRMVWWLSLEPVERYESKAARDKAYYERFRHAPRTAQLVKYYDRLDNVRDMRGWGLEGRLGYLQSTQEKVVESLRARSPDLAAKLEREVRELTQRYQRELAQQSDRLARYRRGDGTLKWKPLLADRALAEGAGLARFTLALFLKELAVVVQTGDQLRIEEFFDGLASTDFFVHYGLFAAGARAGEVAYARYLARYIRPRFVSGLLRTNVALAAGLALPQLLQGQFDGEAFAISLGALGLSSVAVRAGLKGIRWVATLPHSSASAAARLGRLSRLSSVGGWIYTVAETAIVLYVADELEGRFRAWQDERAAQRALGEAGLDLFGRASEEPLAAQAFEEALARYGQAWSDYRDYLYQPVLAEEALLNARLSKLAREAKLAADERQAGLAQLERTPALAARLIAQHGSLEGYLAARAAEDEAKLEREAEAALLAYQRAVEAGLTRIYQEGRRSEPFLAGLSEDARPYLRGEDPWGERGDPFAHWGRQRLEGATAAALGATSSNRIQTYADERAALELLASQLAARPALAARVKARIDEVSALERLDGKLSALRGAAQRLSGQ